MARNELKEMNEHRRILRKMAEKGHRLTYAHGGVFSLGPGPRLIKKAVVMKLEKMRYIAAVKECDDPTFELTEHGKDFAEWP